MHPQLSTDRQSHILTFLYRQLTKVYSVRKLLIEEGPKDASKKSETQEKAKENHQKRINDRKVYRSI